MANFSISNVAIRGISACVPKNVEHNADYAWVSKEEIEKFMDATGIHSRRVVNGNLCTSDLCYAAADKLLNDLQWDRNSIDVLVFVSQTADYILPVTSATLQTKLGLSKECIAFDVPLGCSGYIYGLSVIAGLMKASGLQRGLLLVGDTISTLASQKDKSTAPLFGDAGTCTAIELSEESNPILFNLGTDGTGSEAIIVPHGNARNRITAESFVYDKIEEGIERNNSQLVLEGMDVFSFGITQAPKTVNSLLSHFSIDKESVDYFVFHQANKMMNKMIAKKLKIPEEKTPYSLENFGNTSSATIPLTIVTELRKQVTESSSKLIMCGFGVGLSWGTAYIELNNIICPELIEI